MRCIVAHRQSSVDLIAVVANGFFTSPRDENVELQSRSLLITGVDCLVLIIVTVFPVRCIILQATLDESAMSSGQPKYLDGGHQAGDDDIALLEPIDSPSITDSGPSYSPHPRSPPRPLLPPSPIPILPLPPASSLNLESQASSELELDRQARQIQRERELAEALQDQQFAVERQAARNTSLWTRTLARAGRGGGKEGGGSSDGPTEPFTRPPQAYELYKAIDKHDIEFIMRVRDHAFHLLLQKNAGEFPIVYASRIGKTHRDIVVLLVGALSRYVNQLDDEDFDKKETRGVLRSLRKSIFACSILRKANVLTRRVECELLTT